MENPEELSDSELMSSLVEANRTMEELEPLLIASALVRLAEVDAGEEVQEMLSKSKISFNLTGKGIVNFNVVVQSMERDDQLALIERFEELPGVTVDTDGSMITGIYSLMISVSFDEEQPEQDLSSEISDVQDGVKGSIG